MKTVLSVLGVVCVIGVFLVLCFGIQLGGLHWNGFFAKESANIERKVFEETKSYTHGMSDALAKHYQEYMKASPEDKLIIENVIKMEFGSFDEKNLTNDTLRSFLVSIRGY